MPKYKIIANPIAGANTAGGRIPEIERMLSDHGLDFELERTAEPWHAAGLARTAAEAGYDVVVAMGGDGTANEVLNGVMQARQDGGGSTAIGVLTVGTGNDFAYGVRVPETWSKGARLLPTGTGGGSTSAASPAGSTPRGGTSAMASASASMLRLASRRRS